MRTAFESVARSLWVNLNANIGNDHNAFVARMICQNLGIDPDTPLDRLHGLGPGQVVAEPKDGPGLNDVCLDEDGTTSMLMFPRSQQERRWVVVRSADLT